MAKWREGSGRSWQNCGPGEIIAISTLYQKLNESLNHGASQDWSRSSAAAVKHCFKKKKKNENTGKHLQK